MKVPSHLIQYCYEDDGYFWRILASKDENRESTKLYQYAKDGIVKEIEIAQFINFNPEITPIKEVIEKIERLALLQ